MSRRFIFFYLMKQNAQRIREVVPAHIRYWREHQPANYSGGPFEDRSGGLIMFETDSLEAAQHLARNDPFMLENVIARQWVKSWLPERS